MRRLAILSALLTLGPVAAEPPVVGKGPANRLARESSPYLLQHAHNPVDWQPWGPEAFAKAKAENKLVFLSIGYSSCHWCHVMEKESFADPGVAKVLNEHFVCIKVDREERPDVDDVYMTALHALGSNGGWPLSMFLTADGKPIFGGTYWPKEDRKVGDETVPGFKTVLKNVNDLQKEKPKELVAQADRLAAAAAGLIERNTRAIALVKLDRGLVNDTVAAFELDPEHGGIGSADRNFRGAKFPRPAALGFLLRNATGQPFEPTAKLVRLTLDRMARGGLYDHLGGGFHRYSTERTWAVPHFEKMLYDNAQLVELYAEAYERQPDPAYRRVVAETLAFVAREMTAPGGGFYTALDADSDGREGAFYVWTPAEVTAVLTEKADVDLTAGVYGLGTPHFEEKYVIPRLAKPLAEAARDRGLTEDQLLARLAPLKAKLFAARAKRNRPFLDTKILTGWNGLMIGGYAAAGRVFKDPSYGAAAAKAADFVLANLRAADGRLLRTFAAKPGEKGEAKGNAYLEDYAALAHGLLNLHDATGDARWLAEARAVTDAMIRRHGDGERGGFFTTSHDHEKLFARGKDSYDGVMPSGNGLAARNLVRLCRVTGDGKYKTEAERCVKLFAALLKTNPTAAPLTADALGLLLDPAAGPVKP